MTGNQIEPEPTAREKYSGIGGFGQDSFKRFGFTPDIIKALGEAANHSVAGQTWASYQTAERHIARAEKHTGVQITFPFALKSTLAYIGFLLCPKDEGGRGLQGKSVEKYLSALRLLHMQKGHFEPYLRPEVIKQITRGACNRDQIIKRMEGKAEKMAMTPEIMCSLKKCLKESRFTTSRKRIIWAACTLCWSGALRVHELLSKEPGKFDPKTTMMASAIKLSSALVEGKRVETLQVYLAHPKEERLSAGVKLDLFASEDFMCPVKAYRNWLQDKVVRLSSQKPLFRLADGRNYTGSQFNKDLKSLLKGVVDYSKSPLTSHSFRRGLATFMAKTGYSDEDIMRVGRWHSQAFKAYITAPREIRGRLAAQLAAKVSSSLQLT